MTGSAMGGGKDASGAPRKHPDSASRVYEEKAFIVLPHKHVYEILNPVGTRIWELIDGVRTVDDMVRIIAEEYEVSVETARKDVDEFLSDLKDHGMLAGSDSGKAA